MKLLKGCDILWQEYTHKSHRTDIINPEIIRTQISLYRGGSLIDSFFFIFCRKIKHAFTKYRVSQSLLYGAYILLWYLIILIVVSFNGWLILSVVIGKTVGYFMFTG